LDKRTFLRRFTIAGFVGFTLIVVAVFLRQGLIAKNARMNVEHSHQGAEQIEDVFSRIKDIELGQRGFVLSGDSSYLKLYFEALSGGGWGYSSGGVRGSLSLWDELVALKTHFANNAEQYGRTVQLENLARRRVEHAETVINVRATQSAEAAIALIMSGEGKRIMDSTRALVDQMMGLQQTFIANQRADEDRKLRDNSVMLYAVVVLFYVAWLLSLRIAARSRRRRVSAERDLRESHHLLEAMIHSGSHAIFSTDMAGKILLFNPAAEAMLGFSASDVIGKNAARVLNGIHDRAQIERRRLRLEKRLGRSVRGMELFLTSPAPDEPPDPEWTLIRKNGENFLGSMVVSPMLGSDGVQRGYLSIIRDVTERRMMERRLAESNAMLNAVIESSEYAILACDAQGRVTIVNKSAEHMLGLSAEDFLGNSAEDMMRQILDSDELASRANQLVANYGHVPTGPELLTMALPGQRHSAQEWTMIRKNGVKFPVVMSVSAIKDISGKPLGVVALVSDVSELRKVAGNLTKSNAMFQAVLNGTNYAIFATDAEGRLTVFNRAAETMLGMKAADALGHNVMELLHDLDPREIEERAARIYRKYGRQPEGVELFILPLDEDQALGQEWTFKHEQTGQDVPIMLSVSEMRDDRERVIGYVALSRDISELKANERLKKEFISTVSHELRTPLTSIRGALGLIAGGAAGDLPEGAREMIKIAHRNSERLVRIINDILDIDKIEAGNLALHPRTLDVSSFLQQALESNSGYGEKFGITFSVEAPSDIQGVEITADPDRLMQVMSNLMSNAAKFSPRGAVVHIESEHLGDRVRIAVRDHGPGIPESFRSRVFEKFAQAEGTDARRFEGTGLGLNITKKLIEAMGGQIGFTTKLGTGTRFYFDLPITVHAENNLDEPGESTGDASASAHSDSQKPRVLICEDDVDVGTLLRVLLERAGLATDVVHSLADARARLVSGTYAALTLDLMLPDGSGLSLLRALRRDPSTRELPVIVISARAEEGRQELNGDAIGMIDWISKPIDEMQLQHSVTRALSGSIGGSPSERPRVLHVEDDADFRQVLAQTLGDAAEWVGAATLAEAEAHLLEKRFNLVILDLDLPDGSGLELLERLKSYPGGPVPVLILSASETDNGVRSRVESALVKSRLSEERIVETILAQIRTAGRAASPYVNKDIPPDTRKTAP
jgi:PAS domain S-box-containing protein